MSRALALFVLLTVAAGARILLQIAAMPPYAGLDEIYHVAYASFLAEEHRPPRMGEASIPAYLASSIAGDPAALPAFGVIGDNWPEVVRSRADLLHEDARQVHPYVGANYEAQQPALYYHFASLFTGPPLRELRMLRLFSGFWGLLVVLATALIGYRFFGDAGIVAGALLVSLPTWLTLVVRTSNDAFACAWIAVALAISLCHPKKGTGWFMEGLAWSAACATKLYAWPVSVALPVIWYQQRARKTRMIVVGAAIATSVLLTIAGLHSRTNNPLGLFAFDLPSEQPHAAVPIAYGEMVKVLIASFAWTSGQHFDALRPLAIALYLGPIFLIAAVALRRPPQLFHVCTAAILAFGFAQAINAAGYIRQARAIGLAMPAGGKEAWYWYALAPVIIGIALACVLHRVPAGVMVALVLWIVAWDVVITEGALFHDYAAATSPAHSNALFRWGPWFAPFTADLSHVAVGPMSNRLTLLRTIHVGAMAALVVMSGAFFRRLVPRKKHALLDAPLNPTDADRLAEER
jgi:hypothetical protein